MTVQVASVSTVSSVSALFTLIQQIVSDVKAGKGPVVALADVTPDLVACLEQLSSVPSDISNHQALINTVAVGVAGIANVFIS